MSNGDAHCQTLSGGQLRKCMLITPLNRKSENGSDEESLKPQTVSEKNAQK